jgi:hypothetical protein
MGNVRMVDAARWACGLAVAAGLNGCFISSDDEGPARTSSTAGSGGTTTVYRGPAADDGPVQDTDEESGQPPPEPFAIELATFVPNTVRWAGVDVALIGARQIGGRSDEIAVSGNTDLFVFSYDDPTSLGQLDPYQTYVELDLELTNHDREELDYVSRDTWDLRLADGSRLQSVDSLDVRVLPGDTAATKLHYAVEDGVDLAGAVLVLEGAERAVFEPEQIPLDAEHVRQFPRRIESLVGQVIEDERLRIEVDEAIWDHNVANIGRAKLGKRIVWMNLAVAPLDENGLHWSASETRVSVDGRGIAPREWDHAIVDGNTTMIMFTAFEIDADASTIEVGIPLRDAAELHRFPVDLNASVLVNALP